MKFYWNITLTIIYILWMVAFVLQWQRGDHVTCKALNYLVSDPLKKGLILFLHHVAELET